MAIGQQLSEILKKKIKDLESININQNIEIEKLKKKNAVLHLRLAEALQPSLIDYSNCENCIAHNQEVVLFKENVKEKLKHVNEVIKVIKQDLQNLSRDVVLMINKANQSCESFNYVLCEKLQDVQDYTDDINDLNFKVKQLEESLLLSQELHRKEKERRKELHNTLVQVRGNIRVHCRVRPILEFDVESASHNTASKEEIDILRTPCKAIVNTLSDEVLSVSPSPGKPPKVYEFERVYTHQDDQRAVFDEVKPLLTSFLDGYNVCIMAYGQTGSGKSHTMLGDPDQPGIVPRAADDLFRLIEERNLQNNVEFAVSVAEVYNNDIFDLLADERKRSKHGIVTSGEGSKDVPTLIHIKVDTANDIQAILQCGLERRAKISTKVHEHSSRSHLIVSVTASFQQREEDCYSDPGTPRKRPQSAADYTESDDAAVAKRGTRRQLPQLQLPNFSQSLLTSPKSCSSFSVPSSPVCLSQPVASFKTKLQFVDLAGSECVGMSGVTGAALRESSYINRSLSALADVLGALSEHRSHIPYRNSRLTHLLQDSIGGDAKMLVLLCISPTQKYVTETLQCLGFGARARQIQRGQTKRRGNGASNRSESPAKIPSPRQTRSVVRRVLN